MWNIAATIVTLVTLVTLAGCTPPGGTVKTGGIDSAGRGDSVLEWVEGQTRQAYVADRPTAVLLTPDTVESYGDTNFGTIAVVLPSGERVMASVPNNLTIETAQLSLADGSSFNFQGISVDSAIVEARQVEAAALYYPVLSQLGEQQRDVALQALEQAGEFGAAVVPLLRAMLGAP